MNADVAIGEGNIPVITYSYVRGQEIPFKGGGPVTLITFQTLYGDCNFSGSNRYSQVTVNPYKNDWNYVIGDYPRIAASNIPDSEDFVMSLGTGGEAYDCKSGITSTSGILRLYWKRSGNFGTIVGNDNQDITTHKVYRPAISFESNRELVSVVWSSLDPDDFRNAVAKDFRFDGPDLIPQGTEYSFVNPPSGNKIDELHDFPSVASANIGNFLKAYCWYHYPKAKQVLSRITHRIAGMDPLNSTLGFNYDLKFCDPGLTPDPQRPSISPNPSQEGASIDLNEEGVEKVVLKNQYGNIVFESSVENKKSVQALKALPSGLYNVTITKKGKTTTTKLVIQ
jgi:hypothetical protein